MHANAETDTPSPYFEMSKASFSTKHSSERTPRRIFTLLSRKSVGGVEVFIEAASEGLLWRLGIEVDRQKSEWFGGGIGEEFVKLLQIHIRTNFLMNLLQLVLVFQFEQT